jgi:predicted PurR-regulated permease PerM
MAQQRSSRPRPRAPWDAEILVPVGGLLLLAALGYSVGSMLGPIVLLAALIYFLFPWRHLPLPGRLIGVGVFLCGIWVLVSLFAILVPFLLAFLLAYFLNPIVVRLERRKVPRWAGAAGSVILLVAMGVVAVLFLFPVAFREFNGIIGGLRSIVGDFISLVNSGALVHFFERYGIAGDRVQEFLVNQLTPRLEGVLRMLFDALFGLVFSLSSVVMQVINIVIIPFVVFYLLKDYTTVTETLRRLIPAQWRGQSEGVLRLTDEILGSYFRGSLIVALIQGIIAGVGLWFIGVDYALVLGIMTAVLNFIPYLGLVTSLVVASIVASFSGEPVLLKIVGVVLLYLSQKLLEATVLGPRIVGKKVGLHPVLLILCLLVFGYFLGFLGLLIAVPATALIIALAEEWKELV